MRSLMLLLAVVVLAGCAEPIRWTKDGALVEADVQREDFECMQAAREATPRAVYPATHPGGLTLPGRHIYIRCMETKGYRRAD
ncbi:MAG TPA: hypothetical protein VGV13_14900 [Methylomirabilota bacterium]|jgi:hypothetical protein|nr:hypothetical protein [Methylomirabilota bacterium]